MHLNHSGVSALHHALPTTFAVVATNFMIGPVAGLEYVSAAAKKQELN